MLSVVVAIVILLLQSYILQELYNVVVKTEKKEEIKISKKRELTQWAKTAKKLNFSYAVDGLSKMRVQNKKDINWKSFDTHVTCFKKAAFKRFWIFHVNDWKLYKMFLKLRGLTKRWNYFSNS